MAFGSLSSATVAGASVSAGATGVGKFSCGASPVFLFEQENIITLHSIHRDAIIVILFIHVEY